MDAASHLVLLPGLDGTGELFAPLLQTLGDGLPTSVVRYGAELTFDEYVESAGKALPDVSSASTALRYPCALRLSQS